MSNSLVQLIQVCLIVGWLLLAVGLQPIPVEIRTKLTGDTLTGLFFRKVPQIPGGRGEKEDLFKFPYLGISSITHQIFHELWNNLLCLGIWLMSYFI